MRILKPGPLLPGMTVGLIAPSGAVRDPLMVPKAVAGLEARGYKVRIGRSCYEKHGYLAGSDALRAAEVNRMFADDSIDAIICIRGGYGVTRIQPLLDYPLIAAHPKVFSGYSDITALESALFTKTGLITFQGSMGNAEFGSDDYGQVSHESFLRCVAQTSAPGLLENPDGYPRKTLFGGIAEGRLIGGNLSLLAACCGTPFSYDYSGKIVFIEDINEATYAIDRMLTQLLRSGDLQKCCGILIGEFTNCREEHPDFCLSLQEIFHELLEPLKIPVLCGIRSGHCSPRLTLPIGANCRLDADKQTVYIAESAVREIC